jgi:hypothetical protein
MAFIFVEMSHDRLWRIGISFRFGFKTHIYFFVGAYYIPKISLIVVIVIVQFFCEKIYTVE